jgi:hypothetical protein
MLRAFFAVVYYAALRPEEAAMLNERDFALPEQGWGELLLSGAAPIAGAAWTDSGERRDRRQLKQRAVGEVRHVPSPLGELSGREAEAEQAFRQAAAVGVAEAVGLARGPEREGNGNTRQDAAGGRTGRFMIAKATVGAGQRPGQCRSTTVPPARFVQHPHELVPVVSWRFPPRSWSHVAVVVRAVRPDDRDDRTGPAG